MCAFVVTDLSFYSLCAEQVYQIDEAARKETQNTLHRLRQEDAALRDDDVSSREMKKLIGDISTRCKLQRDYVEEAKQELHEVKMENERVLKLEKQFEDEVTALQDRRLDLKSALVFARTSQKCVCFCRTN